MSPRALIAFVIVFAFVATTTRCSDAKSKYSRGDRITMEKIQLHSSQPQNSQVSSLEETSSQGLSEVERSTVSSSATMGEDGPERYAGYFKLNRTYDAHMFFFYFEAREDPENAPVVLWMTGGPGCSSELAVFYENGPWKIRNDLSLEETEYGWDRAAHMIYVDQPINTGFSWSEDDRDRCYDEGEDVGSSNDDLLVDL